MRRFLERLLRRLGLGPRRIEAGPPAPAGPVRGSIDHVILLDGTLSSLSPGEETNIGLMLELLREGHDGPRRRIYYEAGVQWRRWRDTRDVAFGRGINRQIRRAYGWLATRYRPGDRIFLFGYSRGAYAVRSLAGVIDRVGLVRAEAATERAVEAAYRHYRLDPDSAAARAFAQAQCHPAVEVQMVGVFDTVKALGLRLPLLWLVTEAQHRFHDHRLGPAIRHGFHALALDETRAAFEPVIWSCPPGWTGHVEQVWFRGAHGDIGGQLGGFAPARPLADIPLVWMLEAAESCGLALPPDWRRRYPADPEAPALGSWRGLGKLFLLRRERRIGADPSERLHPTALRSPRAADLEIPVAQFGAPQP